MMTVVKTSEEIQNMRVSGQLLAQVLDEVEKHMVVGATTKDLANVARDYLAKLEPSAKHAFYKFQDFPDVICISTNDAVVHGIPNSHVLENGDVIGIDYGVNYKGMITDSARTIIVGENKKAEKLVKETQASLYAGLDVLKDGVKTGDIGAAIGAHLDRFGFGIIRNLTGHGVGHQVHEEPSIFNFGTKGQGTILKSGMTVAIEPMASLGTDDVVTEKDGWTIAMADGSISAHFEHTVLITDDGHEILTTV